MTKIDITHCELEPVRFMGSVQSFGAVIFANEKSIITHASENVSQFLNLKAESLIGKNLSEVSLEGSHFVCKKKVKNGQIIEFEPHVADPFNDINILLEKIQKAENLNALLQNAANSLWELTKFDRVMIYKFHEDFHGEVMAEALLPGVESFRGLHYPASDIPPQARAIFLENWVRIIPEVSATPVEIIGQELTALDLGRVTMRAVSPIHLEYLKNMEVEASLTVSIIVEDKLWGLFACHHRSQKFVGHQMREAAETIGRMTSALIRESEIKEIHLQSNKLKKEILRLTERLEKSEDIGEELTKNFPNLVDLIHSDGASAAVYNEGYWASVGNVPNDQQIEVLVNWLCETMEEEVFSTNELSKVFPPAKEYKKIASGLLATKIPKSKKSFIIWFRPEVIETVRWAGNPDKTVVDVNGRLTPRASFDEWKVSVEGRSKPWEIWEISAAVDIKNTVVGNDLKRQFEKEKKARHEAELAKHAREELMAVVSHDLRNPLSSLIMNTQLLKKLMSPTEEKTLSIIDRIGRSSQSMSNLIEDILSVTKLEAGHLMLDFKLVEIDSLLKDSMEVLSTLAQEKSIRLEIVSSLSLKAQLDYGRMLQVISNLIGNAIKFTPEKGEILVKVSKSGPDGFIISIKDTGPGIPKENLEKIFDRFWQAKEAKRLGTGLGLAIVKGIIEKHNGEIWAESEPGKGTTFNMKLPLLQPN